MAEENIEIVRKMSEAFNRAGIQGLRPFLDPGIAWHEDPTFPEAGTYYGIEAYEEYANQFLAEFRTSTTRFESASLPVTKWLRT